MTAPRIVVAGATTSITRRTTLRKAFLAPWDPLVRDIWLYALADAQEQHEVEVHQSTVVITHHHTDVTPTKDNLPEFTKDLHRDVSCALHTLLCARRYDAPRELFDDRPAHYLRLLDAPAQASHLVYGYLNNVAAGLVNEPGDMPGAFFDFGLWKTGYIEVERPPVYFSRRRPKHRRLHLTPPPLLYEAFDGDVDRLVYAMNKLSTEGVRALRRARTRPVLGAQRVRRIHPWNEASTMREPGPVPRRTFRLGASGIVATEARIAAATEVREFGARHAAARIARRDGDFTQRFPFGTYQMVTVHGASAEPEPPADAIVARPGPVLADVRAELAERPRATAPGPPRSHGLIDEVTRALTTEAPRLLEHTELTLPELRPTLPRGRPTHDLGSFGPPPTATDADTNASTNGSDVNSPESRPGPVVACRRQARNIEHGPDAPRRVVVLRDRRRGRPARRSSSHGQDPPC